MWNECMDLIWRENYVSENPVSWYDVMFVSKNLLYLYCWYVIVPGQ